MASAKFLQAKRQRGGSGSIALTILRTILSVVEGNPFMKRHKWDNFAKRGAHSFLKEYLHKRIIAGVAAATMVPGQVPEWSKGTDCKSVAHALRRFEPSPAHHIRLQT